MSAKVQRLARWLAVAVIVPVLVAACGSSSSSSSSASGGSSASSTSSSAGSGSGSGSSTVSASTLSAAKATLAQAESAPKWTAPGPAVSASVLKGKALLVFPINSEIDACQTQSQDFAALGRQLGAKVTLVSNSGQPPQWQTAVEDAVGAHDAGVAMLC